MRKLILIAVLVAVAAGAGIVYVSAGGDDARRTGAIGTRSYATGKLALQADGVVLGGLKSASCGAVSADVARVAATIETKVPVDAKQIGPAKYEACELTFGWSADKSLFTWISDALAGKAVRKNLSLSYLDINYVEKARLDLDQAAIAKVAMPKLDASNGNAVYVTLTVAPLSIKSAAGSGAAVQVATSTSSKSQLGGNFRFDYGGAPLTHVTTVEGWSFEFDPATQKPLLGDVDITVSESDPRMPALSSSFKKFVIDGENGDKSQTTASIALLNNTLTATHATVAFTGVGWAAGELVGATSADNSIAKRRFSLYVEGATLTVE
jgi:T4-like virus tail tube protein gp19